MPHTQVELSPADVIELSKTLRRIRQGDARRNNKEVRKEAVRADPYYNEELKPARPKIDRTSRGRYRMA